MKTLSRADSPLQMLALTVLLTTGVGCKPVHHEVTLAAASSLREVMPKLIEACEKKHPGDHYVATYGASGDLQKQVEAGAPIDLVIFASEKPVDALIEEKRVDQASRRVVATNQLVLIAPKDKPGETHPPLTFENLETLGKGERLALGDPGSVPAGQYAKEALVKLGKWDALKDHLVLGADVTATMAYARRGEVRAAIVYQTEVRGIDDVVVLDHAKDPYAPHPTVVAGAVTGSKNSAPSQAFLDVMASDEGRTIFHDAGFGAP